jgi:hypothetical protein
VSYQPPKDYVDVAERIREFRDKHPDGSLQRVDWGVQEVAGKAFIYYTAAAYRSPDDERPGIGTAWEPFPGPTPYTKDSELMNAETSAWGRAIIAAGAADAKRVASANEVANRQPAPAASPAPRKTAQQQQTSEPVDAAQVLADTFGAELNPSHFVFKFGKHKGEQIDAVPSNYLEWLLKQPGKAGYEEQTAAQHAIYQAELDRRAGALV